MKKPVNLIHAPLINAHRYLCSAIILFLLNMSASLSATAQEKWTFVGKPGISTGRSIDPEVGLDSYGTPYVSYVETLGGQAVVKKYDGVEWVAIGGLPAVRYGMLSMAIGGDNYPCVALIDTASKNKITVLKYNGAIWEQLGTSIVANSIEASIKLNVNNGDLYVTYIDEGKNGVITVMKYINGIWSAVGATTLIDNYVRNFSLMFDNGGAPVLTYCNGVFSNSDTAYIGGVRFDGSVWTQICTRIAVTNNIYMSVMDKSGYLYVAYYKNVSSSGSVVRVSKFNGVGWESIGDTTYFNGSSLCVSIKTSLMIDCDSGLCMLYDAYGSGRPVLARYKNGSWKRLGTLMRNLPTYERVVCAGFSNGL